MKGTWFSGWRLPARFLGAFAAPGLLAVGGAIAAGERPSPPPSLPPAVVPAAPAAPVAHAADLASARSSALERQPSVAAAIASLQAAVQRKHALVNLRVPTFLARDLPIRREQAEHGVEVAEAGVTLARMNASYSATFCYLTYLYAVEQEKVAADAIEGLREVKGKLEGDDEDKDSYERRSDVLLIDAYLGIAEARRAEANMGAQRAASALREAMGLCADAPLVIKCKAMPDVCLLLDKRILLELAQARRPEITQARLGADVASLEVDAQGKPGFFAFRVNTFASGSDLHSTPLPSGQFDHDYRPGATGPEMPVTINGGRKDRVGIAEAYAGRAATVVERTKLLIGLETDQAFLRWAEADRKLKHYRKAVLAAEERAEEARTIFRRRGPTDVLPVRELVTVGGLASQARADANKARYDLLVGLAQLERVTAGGFCARLEDAPERPDDVAAARAAARAMQKKRDAKKGK